ncbi:MAG: hypothetical protein QXG10_04470 [Candidatus Hadarchaeales archaeon]
MPRVGQTLSALAIFVFAVFLLIIGMGLISKQDLLPIKDDENLVYGIYSGGERMGELKLWVEGRETVDNVECFVVRYSIYIPNDDRARSGVMKFDSRGTLRRVRIAEAEQNVLKWATEIGYFKQGLMRVVVEDNRIPEAFSEKDETILTPPDATVGEYVWYLIRFDDVGEGYSRRFGMSLMPDATTIVSSRISVSGEENVESPAGTFECWAMEGENTESVPWPVDRMWVSKKDGIVIKASELIGGGETTYLLERA